MGKATYKCDLNLTKLLCTDNIWYTIVTIFKIWYTFNVLKHYKKTNIHIFCILLIDVIIKCSL